MIDNQTPSGFLSRVKGYFRSGYEASDPSHKRRDPGRMVRSSDIMANEGQRRQLINSAGDLQRNFAVAAWAIRKHLDYISAFTYQARTPNSEFNTRLESFVTDWASPKNFDVGGRHSMRRFIRMAEARRVMDGDVFLVKQRTGRLQAVEADRVRTADRAQDRVEGATYSHGIRIGRGGRLAAIAVHNRGERGHGYEFSREIRSRNVEQLAYWDGFDAKRGISPMASAINDFQDIREVKEYARAKAKLTQLFALAITRQGDDSEEVSDDYQVDFGAGPIKLDLDPGDEATFLESKHPSTEFQQFLQTSLMAALKCLDLPYSFADESFTNFFGSRAAVAHYIKSCSSKRADLVELLDNLTRWRLSLAVATGQLVLPAGVAMESVRWEWVPAGVPFWDPLKDVTASIMAIQAGLTTRGRIIKETYGGEFTDTIDTLETEQAYAASRNVSLAATLPQVAGVFAPKEGDPADGDDTD